MKNSTSERVPEGRNERSGKGELFIAMKRNRTEKVSIRRERAQIGKRF